MKTLTSKLIAVTLLLSVAQPGFAMENQPAEPEVVAVGAVAEQEAPDVPADQPADVEADVEVADAQADQTAEQAPTVELPEESTAPAESVQGSWYSNAWNATTGFARNGGSYVRDKVTGATGAAWNFVKPFEARTKTDVATSHDLKNPKRFELLKRYFSDSRNMRDRFDVFLDNASLGFNHWTAEHPKLANTIFYPTMLVLAAVASYGTYKGITAFNNWRKLRNKSDLEKVRELRTAANELFAAQLSNETPQSVKPLAEVCKELNLTNEVIVDTVAEFDRNFIAQDGTLVVPVKVAQQRALQSFFDTLDDCIGSFQAQ